MGINVQAIRSSYELLKSNTDQVADLVYEILLTEFPDSKALCAGAEVEKIKKAFMDALTTAVENLDKPDSLTKFILDLGECYAAHGVQDFHYEWVGKSLLKAFRQYLGDQWTTDLQVQWGEVYGVLAEAMKVGARNAKPKVRTIQRQSLSEASIQIPKSMNKDPELDLTLPNSVKQHIQNSVDQIINDLVRAEIKRCFDERLQQISRMSAEELVKNAS